MHTAWARLSRSEPAGGEPEGGGNDVVAAPMSPVRVVAATTSLSGSAKAGQVVTGKRTGQEFPEMA